MSILIKKMEKPKTCALCPFREIRYKPGYYNYEHCSALNRIFNENKLDIDPYKERLGDCPLIEIPTPHGRLIDANKFRIKFNRTESGYCGSWEFCDKPEDFQFLIDDEPTILEAEE